MEVKQNLNATNFFTEDLRARYPVAMKVFTEWFDKYTDAIGWTALFGKVYLIDIPFEMQVGILVRFIEEHNQTDLAMHYYQEYFVQDLTESLHVINWFAGFLQWYDQDHNPDHLLTNPPGEEDDLPF